MNDFITSFIDLRVKFSLVFKLQLNVNLDDYTDKCGQHVY